MNDADVESLRGICSRNPVLTACVCVLLLIGYDHAFDYVAGFAGRVLRRVFKRKTREGTDAGKR